jgi:ribosomal-protein-alanine N-acetyltransferase
MENLASHAVLRNNEFTPWGVAHAHIYLDGAWHDDVFWERTLTGH